MKRLGVAAIISGGPGNEIEHIVLGRRAKDPNRGLFVLPGGGVQEGETLDEALRREIKEETGLVIEPNVSRWKKPRLIELSDRIILITHVYGMNDFKLTGGSDLYDVAWFPYNKLPKDISPVITPFLMEEGYLDE